MPASPANALIAAQLARLSLERDLGLTGCEWGLTLESRLSSLEACEELIR